MAIAAADEFPGADVEFRMYQDRVQKPRGD